MSKLAKLRNGTPEYEIVNFPGTNEKVAIIALNNRDIIKSREEAIRYVTDHPVDMDTGDLILNMFVLAKAMREPDNLEEYFTDGFDDINENMDPKSVYELHNVFIEVQNGKVPDLDDLSIEEFEDIKKKLEKMEMSELDGELQTILKYFHQTLILKDLLKDR